MGMTNRPRTLALLISLIGAGAAPLAHARADLRVQRAPAQALNTPFVAPTSALDRTRWSPGLAWRDFPEAADVGRQLRVAHSTAAVNDDWAPGEVPVVLAATASPAAKLRADVRSIAATSPGSHSADDTETAAPVVGAAWFSDDHWAPGEVPGAPRSMQHAVRDGAGGERAAPPLPAAVQTGVLAEASSLVIAEKPAARIDAPRVHAGGSKHRSHRRRTRGSICARAGPRRGRRNARPARARRLLRIDCAQRRRNAPGQRAARGRHAALQP